MNIDDCLTEQMVKLSNLENYLSRLKGKRDDFYQQWEESYLAGREDYFSLKALKASQKIAQELREFTVIMRELRRAFMEQRNELIRAKDQMSIVYCHSTIYPASARKDFNETLGRVIVSLETALSVVERKKEKYTKA